MKFTKIMNFSKTSKQTDNIRQQHFKHAKNEHRIRKFWLEYSLFTNIFEYFKKIFEYLFEYSAIASIRIRSIQENQHFCWSETS
jgi:hypothetical protein